MPPPSHWDKLELDVLVDSKPPEPDQEQLVPLLKQLTEILLGSWLSHSRTLRLSVLETIDGSGSWKSLCDFIQQYGKGLLTQGFLKLLNVRAILHQGVGKLSSTCDGESRYRRIELTPLCFLLELLHQKKHNAGYRWSLKRSSIITVSTSIYNSTTTQSDRRNVVYVPRFLAIAGSIRSSLLEFKTGVLGRMKSLYILVARIRLNNGEGR